LPFTGLPAVHERLGIKTLPADSSATRRSAISKFCETATSCRSALLTMNHPDSRVH